MAVRSSATLVRGWGGRGRCHLTRVAAAVAGGGLGRRCRCGRRETRICIRWVRHVRRGCRSPAVLGASCVGGRREPDSADSGQRGQGCCNRQISQ